MTTSRETADDTPDIAIAKIATIPQLPYGVAVPIWRRRWLRRTVLWALLLTTVFGLIRHFYGRQIEEHVSFFKRQRAALSYRESPATVLYAQSERVSYDNVSSNVVRQLTWTPLHDHLLTEEYNDVVDDADLLPGGGARPAGRQYNRLVFLHERSSPDGTRRIVEVGVSMSWSPHDTQLTARVRLFEPGSLLNPKLKVIPVANRRDTDGGIIPAWPGGIFKLFDVPFGHTTKLYAGQPHSDDESGFLIPYQLDNQSGVIRGRLLDGDRVVFEGRPKVVSTQPARAK